MRRSLLSSWLALALWGGCSSAATEPPGLAAEMVTAHNAVRAGVGSPPLTWDPQLALDAQTWADELIGEEGLRHSSHESRPGEGENLARIDGGLTTATDLFDTWADEAKVYPGGPIDCADLSRVTQFGHYTQVIWKRTRRVGCAMAARADSQVLVCRYAPPGNYCGEPPT